MTKLFPERAAIAAALALTFITLTGCGVAEEAKDKLGELANEHAAKFEPATRVKVEDAPDGRTYILRVEALKETHWYDARAAMYRDLGSYCADGVPFSVRRMTPAHDPRATPLGEYTWFPAGTVFEQVISCSDPFAGERRLAADADHMQSLEALKAELVGASAYDPLRHLYTAVSFGGQQLKYPAVTELVGSMVMGVSRRCRDAGVTVQRVLVHSRPSPDPSSVGASMHSTAFLGVDVVCADGQPADPLP